MNSPSRYTNTYSRMQASADVDGVRAIPSHRKWHLRIGGIGDGDGVCAIPSHRKWHLPIGDCVGRIDSVSCTPFYSRIRDSHGTHWHVCSVCKDELER